MIPKLRRDVYFAATMKSTYLLTPDGPTSIAEPDLALWVERLRPFLDGGHPLDELTLRFPERQRPRIMRVLDTLLESGAIADVSAADSHTLGREELSRHQPEIAFLGSFRPTPRRLFESYRKTRCAVIGSPALCLPMVTSCLHSGLSQISLSPSQSLSPEQTELLAEVRHEYSGARISQCSAGEVAQHCDIALLAAESEDADWLEEQLARCSALGIVTAFAVVDAGTAWIGPAGASSADRAWRSIIGRSRPGEQSAESCGQAPGREQRTAGLTLVCAQLVSSMLRFLAGIPPMPDPGRVCRLSLDTWETTVHRLLAHPLTQPAGPPTRAEFLELMDQLTATAPLTKDEFAEHVAECVDPLLGPISAVREHGAAQLPVSVYEATVSDPVGRGDAHGAVPVIGIGAGRQEAIYQATLNALAMYGALMVDDRRFGPSRTIWGYGLIDGQAHRINADRVFVSPSPASRHSNPPPEVAAGRSWNEAITSALTAHCRGITLARLWQAKADPLPRVDLANAPLDPPCQTWLEILRALALGPLSVHDASALSGLGVPTFVVSVAEKYLACASGSSVSETLSDAVLQALHKVQRLAAEKSSVVWEGLPRMPLTSPPGSQPDLHPRDVDLPGIIDAYRRIGIQPIAVPLDHDPAVHQRVPHIVRVVVAAHE